MTDGYDTRHFVLELHPSPTGSLATIACAADRVPYDRDRHTLVFLNITCSACQAAQAARLARF